MEKFAALIGDAPGHLSAKAGALASHDEGGLLGERGRDLDLLQKLYGGPVVPLAAVEGGGLLQGLIDGLDGLILEETGRLYFALPVAYKNSFAFQRVQDGGQRGG